jgi:hypothetical protein
MVTVQSKILLGSVGHSAVELEWVEEEEVFLDMGLWVEKLRVRHTGQALGKYSPAKDVCPAMAAMDGCILESPDAEVLE